MKLSSRTLICCVALFAGAFLFAGCQKKEVVVSDGETTTVANEEANAGEEINLEEILVVDVEDAAADAATTGDENFAGATTGSDFQFDSATTGDTEAINIDVIEDEESSKEASAASAQVPSAFFFNI